MISRTTRSTLALLVAGVMSAALAVTGVSPAFAATKPSIGAVALHDREFLTATAVVFGATGVAICVSRRCSKALRSRPGLWILNAGETPLSMRKGQRREVIVFAVNATGQFSFSVQRVTVR